METRLKLKFVIVVMTPKNEIELGLISQNKILDLYQVTLVLPRFAGETTARNQISEHIERVILKNSTHYDMEFTLTLGSANEHIATVHLSVPAKSIALKTIDVYPLKKVTAKALSPSVRQLMVEMINARDSKKS